MSRFLVILLLCLVFVAGSVGYRYLSWVLNWQGAETPFDEVGISLHSYMPGFVQDWGCAKLKEEFGDRTMPPYGCRGDSGWR
ncbi:hypothetical protein [Pseudogemmobacter sonorensis]|uniref:hypothetical protein n=1 Tax=Pseudogemmobacter sonorensis TaxID=2989681 RepID=UPI0036BF0746